MAKTLIAAYMPAWQSPCEPQTQATWGTAPWVTTSPVNFMGDHPERWPSYGAVNEDDQAIIDQHLTLAAAAHIDVFGCCWYAGWAAEYGIRRLLASTSSSPVKAFVLWCNHFASMDASHCNKPFLFEAIRLAALYMVAQPRYYVRSGRPVLGLFSSQHLDDTIRMTDGQPVTYIPTLAERNALVADIRNVVGNVLTGDTTGGIVGSTVKPSTNAGPFLLLMDSTWGAVVGIDAMSMYSQTSVVIDGGTAQQVVRRAHSYDEMDTGCRQTWSTGSSRVAPYGKEYWPTIMTGWDRTPWGGTPGDPLADNIKPTKAQFKVHCQAAKTAMAATTANGTGWAYPWNEHGESFPINPTPGSGLMYSNVLAAVFP